MSGHDIRSAKRPAPDQVLKDIADYVCDYKVKSSEAYKTARYILMDTLGCGMLALDYPACTKLLGPVVPGAVMPGGARNCRGRPSSSIRCRPHSTSAPWCAGWTSTTPGSPPSGATPPITLAASFVADYVSRRNVAEGKKPLSIKDVLTAMIKAHEIQGVLALENATTASAWTTCCWCGSHPPPWSPACWAGAART